MSKAMQTITVFIAGTILCFFLCGMCAETAQAKEIPTPPNATKVVKYKSHYYALYKGNVCALTKVNKNVKTLTVPKCIKVKGKKYKVVAIHDLDLSVKKGKIKKVVIKANSMETVEEPMFFKSWKSKHYKSLKVVIADKDTRDWLNAR